MASPVVEEIKRQLIAQGVDLRRKTLVQLDENTLRVHTPGKVLGKGGGKSVDISYNQGNDLYDISFHKIMPNLKIKTSYSKNLFSDNLPNLFDEKLQSRLYKKSRRVY